jgi:zinc/manganese transport system permease protein
VSAVADLLWLAAPVAALLAACALLVPLGAQVLARGVVFIDLAVAQVAAGGALAVGMAWEGASPLLSAGATAAAALLGSGFVWWLARRWPEQREALIGLVYVAGASACVVAVAFDPHGRERLTALLAADILWAPWQSAAVLAAGAAAVFAIGGAAGRRLHRDALFYPVFALSLSLAVPVLGLYLVFAMLIAPALWLRRDRPLHIAVLRGIGASLAGLAASWALDWPSGACVSVALCALGLAAAGKGAHGADRADPQVRSMPR